MNIIIASFVVSLPLKPKVHYLISGGIVLRWMPQDHVYDESTLSRNMHSVYIVGNHLFDGYNLLLMCVIEIIWNPTDIREFTKINKRHALWIKHILPYVYNTSQESLQTNKQTNKQRKNTE